MRKHIILAAMAVLAGLTAVTAIAGGWSIAHKAAGNGELTKASAISPHDITVKQGSSLPAQYWSHPY
jgi:hypothetical protein